MINVARFELSYCFNFTLNQVIQAFYILKTKFFVKIFIMYISKLLKECSKCFRKARKAVESPYARCFDPVTREKLNEIKIKCRQQKFRNLNNEVRKLEKEGRRTEKDAYIAMHVRKTFMVIKRIKI